MSRKKVNIKPEVKEEKREEKMNSQSFYDTLCENMKKYIVGQDHVLKDVLPYVSIGLNVIDFSNKPISCILLAGPPATGKTYFVEKLAECVHGERGHLLKINCTEYQNEHEIARLIGAPPGYIGHRETRAVLSQVKIDALSSGKANIRFILFDEIEKAAPTLFNLLLNVMENGELGLGDGTRTNFSKSMIFFTSNWGSHDIIKNLQGGFGFQRASGLTSEKINIKKYILKKASPEFLSRLDKIIVFNPLTEKQKHEVVLKELDKLNSISIYKFTRKFKFKNLKRIVHWVMNRLEDGGDLRNIRRIVLGDLLYEIIKFIDVNGIEVGDIISIDVDYAGNLQIYLEKEGNNF